jgi:hypothetical protein
MHFKPCLKKWAHQDPTFTKKIIIKEYYHQKLLTNDLTTPSGCENINIVILEILYIREHIQG